MMRKTKTTIEWVPDKEADKPLTEKQMRDAKRVDVNNILSKQQQQELGEFVTRMISGSCVALTRPQD